MGSLHEEEEEKPNERWKEWRGPEAPELQKVHSTGEFVVVL